MTNTLAALYGTIAPVCAIVAAGFLATRCNLLSAEAVRALASYVARVAAPVMVFSAVASGTFSVVGQSAYAAAYAIGSVLAFTLCAACLRVLTRARGATLAFGALGGSFGNTLMVGFPLATLLFGDGAAVALALTVMVEVAIMLPLTLTLAEAADTPHANRVRVLAAQLLSTLQNPLIIAMLLGATVAFFGATLPGALATATGMVAGTVAPVGLFVIGGLMVGYQPTNELPRQLVVVPCKLLVHPALVGSALWLLGVRDAVMIGAALCFSASPIFGAYAAISQRFGIGAQSASLMVVTTVAAAITLPLVLWGLLQLLAAH